MNILKSNLDGTNQTNEQIPAFAEPGANAQYLQYAQDQSTDCLVILGDGFDNPSTRKTISAVAIDGVVVVDNISE